MTNSNRTTAPRHGLPAIGLLLVAAGCNQLAPGINPIASDPPSYATYAAPTTDPTVAAKPWRGGQASDDPAADGELIAADDADGERYIVRQYPQTYSGSLPAPAPQPGYQPPPTYRSPTYQDTYGSNPPPSAYQVQPPSVQQAQPPSGYATPPGMAPQPLPADAVTSPSDALPFYPGGPLADSIYGPQGSLDPYLGAPTGPPVFTPNTRMADLELTGVPARTGRIMFGGAVNSDAGVTGQITLDVRNFDITRWPTSFQDFANGTAFRGAGQTLRIEAVPGSLFKRYTASFADPNLFGYLPISLGVSGFLYDRRFQDYDEERLGARVSLGYRVTPDLSLSAGLTGQNVKIHRPRVNTVEELNKVVRDNELYTGEFKLTHDTRDSPFQPSEGHFLELGYERAFGDFDYSRYEIENRNYLLVAQRADGSGKQTLSLGTRLGFSGSETPIFENYFAGGYSTMRGFDFRGASPVINGVQVGGRFQWLNTLEYMFPITADDAFRGVAFVDFGTVERDIEVNRENFRVAPGLGLRVAIPMLGPAPLAFDFAYPVTKADGDEKRIFSFYMSAIR